MDMADSEFDSESDEKQGRTHEDIQLTPVLNTDYEFSLFSSRGRGVLKTGQIEIFAMNTRKPALLISINGRLYSDHKEREKDESEASAILVSPNERHSIRQFELEMLQNHSSQLSPPRLLLLFSNPCTPRKKKPYSSISMGSEGYKGLSAGAAPDAVTLREGSILSSTSLSDSNSPFLRRS